MANASSKSNVKSVERRKDWRDRRTSPDRRNPDRLSHEGFDCRTGLVRRAADISGKLNDGEVWW